MTNVGVRPTFDNGHPSVEAYLLDFDGDLYGETLGLSFIQRLRPEQKFASVEDLIAQMRRDVAAGRSILADPPSHANAARGRSSCTPRIGRSRSRRGIKRELFATAAAAMFALEDADPLRPITLARSVSVTAANAPELMVAWLNRLLLSQELDGEMYTRFEIHEISARGLRGVAYGYRGQPDAHGDQGRDLLRSERRAFRRCVDGQSHV